jgi:hypothetical protein
MKLFKVVPAKPKSYREKFASIQYASFKDKVLPGSYVLRKGVLYKVKFYIDVKEHICCQRLDTATGETEHFDYTECKHVVKFNIDMIQRGQAILVRNYETEPWKIAHFKTKTSEGWVVDNYDSYNCGAMLNIETQRCIGQTFDVPPFYQYNF